MKLSKTQRKQHGEAESLLSLERKLTYDERLFCLDHWQPAMHGEPGIHGVFFTPRSIAESIYYPSKGSTLDACAGIGRLAFHCQQASHWSNEPSFRLTCVEANPLYVEVGKRIMPDAEWIRSDLADYAAALDGKRPFRNSFSNPPYGHVPTMREWKGYSGPAHLVAAAILADITRVDSWLIIPQSDISQEFQRQRTPNSAAYERLCKHFPGISLNHASYDLDYARNEWIGARPVVTVASLDYESHPAEPAGLNVQPDPETPHASAMTATLPAPTTTRETLKFHSGGTGIITPAAAPAPKPFRFALHQWEDLPRAAMHDGAILSWDPGLGKTLGGLTLAELQEAKRTLIVAPGSLHDQWRAEAFQFFGIEIIPIPDQEAGYRLMREGILPYPGQEPDPNAPPRYFITSYTALGYNGSDEREKEGELKEMTFNFFALRSDVGDGLAALLAAPNLREFNRWKDTIIGSGIARKVFDTGTRFRPKLQASHEMFEQETKLTLWQACLAVNPDFPVDGDAIRSNHITRPLLEAAFMHAGIPPHPGYDVHRIGVGKTKDGIRCVMAPSLSTIIGQSFDCALVDEGVRLKSMDAYIAEGVLRLTPKYRYVLTGTPIKNRLPDIFALAAWVTGYHETPSARWPYSNTTAARAEFANEHMVGEVNETKAEETGRRYCKRTNQITNVHHLWKLLGPVVVRRRKDQLGEGIVKKIIKPIRIAPGTDQLRTYKWHTEHKPEAKNALAAMGMQLLNLRQAALAPNSENLLNRSRTIWTPKLGAILGLAADLMEQGEQLVVFSPFQQFSKDLAAVLARAGVPCAVLDGNISPAKRGQMAKDFKIGRYPVLIAGMQSMGEGHSFANCSHLVLPSLEWALDVNWQAIERVHRLNSPKDVTIYLMVTQNTVDERLASVMEEKGDAADLALDGRLFEHAREEPDLAAFMRAVVAGFDPNAETVSEEEIAEEFREVLSPRLNKAAERWRNLPPLAEDKRRPKPSRCPNTREAPRLPEVIANHGSLEAAKEAALDKVAEEYEAKPARPARPAGNLLDYAARIALLRQGSTPAAAATAPPPAKPATPLATAPAPALPSTDPAGKLHSMRDRIAALRQLATKN